MRYNFVQAEWCVVEEFPEYEINSVGIVRKRRNQVLVYVHVDNYETVLLAKDGKRYHRSVNALVRKAFPDLVP
jgi:hypothetical protein